ncbi:MAG TPA: cupin domain-containing protein [Allosphingosinicella sp.]|jgi:hypothetical protein
MLRPYALDGPLDRVVLLEDSDSLLATRIRESNAVARSFAERRLTRHFPETAIRAFGTYFQTPSVHGADPRAGRHPHTLARVLEAICQRTHDFQIGEKARGMQIGVLPGPTPIAIEMLGDRVEPDSSLCRPFAEGLAAAAAGNASIEIRVFDRHVDEWAEVADDIASVSAADIFMKLFIAGGEHSVNDWHRDTSDVVVTMLDGRKRFQVATANSDDASPEDEVDALLQPGDVLLLPRSRIHKATPAREVSALLSIGLMRIADWSYRSVSPTHLNLVNPRSPALYRLSLRAHVAPTPGEPAPEDRIASRLPGGLGLVSDEPHRKVFLAGGRLWQADSATLDHLVAILGSDSLEAGRLAAGNGGGPAVGMEIQRDLLAAGLVRKR